jgi:hypothetical protein
MIPLSEYSRFNSINSFLIYYFTLCILYVRRLVRTTASKDGSSGKRSLFQYELSVPASYTDTQSVST